MMPFELLLKITLQLLDVGFQTLLNPEEKEPKGPGMGHHALSSPSGKGMRSFGS